MTFRWKLFLSYLILALLMTGTVLLYVNWSLEQRLVDESRANLLHQARLARLVLETNVGRPPQRIAEQLGSAITARVTLIAPDGRVLADSDVRSDQVAGLENHRQREEVQQALQQGSGSALRHSTTLRTTMLYVALNGTGDDRTILRLALPLDYLDRATDNLHRVLGGAFLLVLVLASAFSVLLSRVTATPLRLMADAASRIGLGDRSVRIPVSGQDEVGYLARMLNEMADRIEGQVQTLADEQHRLDTILRGMGEGVMVLDSQGVITLVNPAFRRQFGLSGPVEGRPLAEVCRHPDLLEALEEHQQSGAEVVREVHLQLPELVLSTHWVPLGDQQGAVAVFHDISDLKRIEAVRRDFVANASHELRTPVAVIKGYAETLLDGGLQDAERCRQFVQIIASHAERLTNLINDILTLSKLESKETALECHPFDVCGLIRKAGLLMGEHARQQGISLVIDCPEQGLPKVPADHGRLEQVLLNLLDNAIKYTPSGGTVTLSAEQRGQQVALVVSDTGVGIPAKDLPRIFERFYRVDEGRSREQGGTGLGLAIVKHIVQLHGGEVQVSSEPGRGSRFTVLLQQA
jgi:two-component system phosphate regulon sensor histidine kinase PhoR